MKFLDAKLQLQKRNTCIHPSIHPSKNVATTQTLLEIAFGGGRTAELSRHLKLSEKWILALRLYMIALFLAAQNMVLGSLILMATQQQPLFVMTRLSWDETGEKAKRRQNYKVDS